MGYKKLKVTGAIAQYNPLCKCGSGQEKHTLYTSMHKYSLVDGRVRILKDQEIDYEKAYASAQHGVNINYEQHAVKGTYISIKRPNTDNPNIKTARTYAHIYKLPQIETRLSLLKIKQQLRQLNPAGSTDLVFKNKETFVNYKTLESEGFCLIIVNRDGFTWESLVDVILELDDLEESEMFMIYGTFSDLNIKFSLVIDHGDVLGALCSSVKNKLSKQHLAKNSEQNKHALYLYPNKINIEIISPPPPNYEDVIDPSISEVDSEFTINAEIKPQKDQHE